MMNLAVKPLKKPLYPSLSFILLIILNKFNYFFVVSTRAYLVRRTSKGLHIIFAVAVEIIVLAMVDVRELSVK